MHTKGDWKAEGWLIVKDVKTPRLRYAIAETNCCDGISDKEAYANAQLIAAAPKQHTACEAFLAGWLHFCDCIDFGKSHLDADAIRFMNEVPGQIRTAVKAATS